MLADFVDLHDVGMLQPGHRPGLGAEPREMIAARVVAGEDHLDRRPGDAG